MYLTKIRLSAISALLFTIFVKHGDAFSIAKMLAAMFRNKPGKVSEVPKSSYGSMFPQTRRHWNEYDELYEDVAEVPKSSYVSLFPQTRRHWNEYDDLYEGSNEFHPSSDQYRPAGYYSPRDEFDQYRDDFHSSSDNDIPKISVVYNNIFLMSHHDNNKEGELPNVQEQNLDIRDSSFDYSMCLNPANWATCASHVTGFVNKEYKRPDAKSPNVLRAVLDLLGNKNILKSENEQRAPPIEPSTVANRNNTENKTLMSAESRNMTKLEKPTGRDLNSRNSSVPDINVAKIKSPLTTGHEKAKISPGNSTYIPYNSTYIPHKSYLGRNHTSGSGNSTVHLSRGDKNKLDKID